MVKCGLVSSRQTGAGWSNRILPSRRHRPQVDVALAGFAQRGVQIPLFSRLPHGAALPPEPRRGRLHGQEHRYLLGRDRKYSDQGPRNQRLQAVRGRGPQWPPDQRASRAPDRLLRRWCRYGDLQAPPTADRCGGCRAWQECPAALQSALTRLRRRRPDLPLRLQPRRLHRAHARRHDQHLWPGRRHTD